MEFLIQGEVPAKKNSRINTRSGRSFPSRRYVEWHNSAVFGVRAQWGGKPQETPCRIEVEFVHGDLRRRDGDNGLSSVLDLLVDAGVLEDDSWRQVPEISVRNGYEKGNPRCIVRISEMKEE